MALGAVALHSGEGVTRGFVIAPGAALCMLLCCKYLSALLNSNDRKVVFLLYELILKVVPHYFIDIMQVGGRLKMLVAEKFSMTNCSFNEVDEMVKRQSVRARRWAPIASCSNGICTGG